MKNKWLFIIIVLLMLMLMGAIAYYYQHKEEGWQKGEADITFIEDDYRLYEAMLIERKYQQSDCLPFRNVQLNGVANIIFIKSNHSKIYYKKDDYTFEQKVKDQTLYLDFKGQNTNGFVYVYTSFPIDTFKTVCQEYVSGMLQMLGFENDACHFIAHNAGLWIRECDLKKIQVTLSEGAFEIYPVTPSGNLDIAVDMRDESSFRFKSDQPVNLALAIKSHDSFSDIEVDNCTHIRKIDLQGSYKNGSQLIIKSELPLLNCDTLILQTENNEQLPLLSIPYKTTIHYRKEFTPDIFGR